MERLLRAPGSLLGEENVQEKVAKVTLQMCKDLHTNNACVGVSNLREAFTRGGAFSGWWQSWVFWSIQTERQDQAEVWN